MISVMKASFFRQTYEYDAQRNFTGKDSHGDSLECQQYLGKNKQNNQDKREKYQRLIITYACRCKQQRREVMTSQKLNLDWLTHSEIKH